MHRRKVLLISMQPLLGEGLQQLLDSHENVDLVALPCTDYAAWQTCAAGDRPDIILIAGEREDDAATHLISSVLNFWIDTPVVWIELETNIIRKYTSHTLPANSRELIETIQQATAVSARDLPIPTPPGGSHVP